MIHDYHITQWEDYIFLRKPNNTLAAEAGNVVWTLGDPDKHLDLYFPELTKEEKEEALRVIEYMNAHYTSYCVNHKHNEDKENDFI